MFATKEWVDEDRNFEITYEEDTSKIAAKDAELRSTHVQFREEYPEASQPKGAPALSAADAHRKKLIYRSKQRGWLEVDLLLGTFAEECLGDVADEHLAQYESILNLETIDIYNVISGQIPPPPQVEENPGENIVLAKLKDFVAASPIGVADPQMYAERKKKMSN